MKFELPPLPYSKDALHPHIGVETVSTHYEKHHQGYLDKLEKAISGTPEAEKDLVDIIKGAEGSVFNNAAQVWNHTFYWNSMDPKGGGKPKGALGEAIERDFGSYDAFRERFAECAAKDLFGSGYVWLIRESGNGQLVVEWSDDAENPLPSGRTPILGLDMWEHAYYLDYKNEKARYIAAFLDHLVNWEFAARNHEGSS